MSKQEIDESPLGEWAMALNGWETTPEKVIQRHYQDMLVPLKTSFHVAARPHGILQMQYVSPTYALLLLSDHVADNVGGQWRCRVWDRNGRIPVGVAPLVLALAEQDEEPDYTYMVSYGYMLELGCTLLSALWESALKRRDMTPIAGQAAR